LKPAIPEYGLLNVQIRGYDFPVVEAFGRYVHRLAENFNVTVTDGYALASSDHLTTEPTGIRFLHCILR
jgi:large subunit ribosomal protein L48